MNSTEENLMTAGEIARIGKSLGVIPEAAEEFHKASAKLGGQDFWTLWRYWKLAVDRKGKHSYEGTVPEASIAKRRAKNKAARISRRANRK